MKKSILKILLIIPILIFNCQKIEEKKEGVTVKGNFTSADVNFFVKFVKEMEKAVANKDVEKSLSFYSDDFINEKGFSKDKLIENIKYIYENYDNIVYRIKNLVVTVKGDIAVSKDEYEYTALPLNKKLQKLEYKGSERIYWKKYNNEWKIVEWIVE